MINSTSSSDRSARTDAVPPSAVPRRPAGVGSDQFSARQADALRAALISQPEIRPEVLARGQALAADPGYPPPAVLQAVAEKILRAPDLADE